jgi:heat shock protein 1/8
MDYTSSINRMRFDMLGSPIYAAVAKEITALLASEAIDPHDVNEVVYIGGTSCLPGLNDRLCVEVGLREDIETPFIVYSSLIERSCVPIADSINLD